ncbi:hypothetical protein ACU4GR_13485 [Methylobacterium oryzae CBMB20]
MANIVRPAGEWGHLGDPPITLLRHEEPEWQYAEVEYGPGGTWDAVTSCLHIAAHPDPLRQRLGSVRTPFQTVPPSTAISAPGDHLTGAWEGSARGQHIRISLGFVAAALQRDVDEQAISKRHFAYRRECDGADTVIRNLLGAMSAHLSGGSPGGAIFMQSVVLALIHHAIPTSWIASEVTDLRGASLDPS